MPSERSSARRRGSLFRARPRRLWPLVLGNAVLVFAAAVLVIVYTAHHRPGRAGTASAGVDHTTVLTTALPALTGRPLTAAEAGRLAGVRYRNFQRTGVRFRATAPTPQGPIPLLGFLDFRRHLGYAATSLNDGTRTDTAALQWNSHDAVTWLGVGDGSVPPAQLPTGATTPRALQPASVPLDSTLQLLLDLGSDRMDDAQLLGRSDARWLRADMVGTVRVDVLAGPADSGEPPDPPSTSLNSGAPTTFPTGHAHFWVDRAGQLLRFEADLPSGTVTVDLDASGFTAFPASVQLSS